LQEFNAVYRLLAALPGHSAWVAGRSMVLACIDYILVLADAGSTLVSIGRRLIRHLLWRHPRSARVRMIGMGSLVGLLNP